MTDAWGIDPSYKDAFERAHVVPTGTVARLRQAIGTPSGEGRPLMIRRGDRAEVGVAAVELEDGTSIEVDDELPPDLPLGYHQIVTAAGRRRLIVSPDRCHVPADQAWGWSTQLYATRSADSWGMGDLADLGRLAGWTRSQGGGLVLVNPLSAVAPTIPQQPSPYYPTSRRFLNPIYIRPELVPGAEEIVEEVERAARAGQELNRRPLVHRDEVWRLKLAVLERLWERSVDLPAFTTWLANQGPALEEFALWCAISEEHGGDWRRWPGPLRHPENAAVADVRAAGGDRIRFQSWLQWLCHLQLNRATDDVMLIQDLPIGFDPGGADAWAWQELIADEVVIGAPPDEFNTQGQDWGLPPFVPHRLAGAGYEPFIQTIRANLATGGGLRIDHVMGLFRQFWIPDGTSPADGGYVRFPHRELLDIVALESTRAQAVIVGEDLGTVEPMVRKELAERKILTYRLLWFEADEPSAWPTLSMASVTTHDLPTVSGMWTGSDLEEQESFGMEPNVESTKALRDNIADAARLAPDAHPAEAVLGVHQLLAQAPSLLMCATLDDVVCGERRPNLPGADRVRDNWRLPLPETLEEIVTAPLAGELSAILARETP